MHRTLSHKLLSTCLCRLPMSVGAGMRLMILSCAYQQVSLIFSSIYHLFFPAFIMHFTWAASWSYFRMMPGKGWPLYMTTQYCPSSMSDKTTGHSHLIGGFICASTIFAEALVCCCYCPHCCLLCRLSRSVIFCAYLITPSSLYFFHLSRPFLRYSVIFVGSASRFCLYQRCFSAGVRGIFTPEQQCHNIYIN